MQPPPPAVLATWPVPNITNPVIRGHALVIIAVLFTVFSFITVILRLYTRLYKVKSWGLDDVLICIALVGILGLDDV
jgi:hypothetical protein